METRNLIHEALSEAELSLVDSQTLVGKLTFVCSMAPWARTFLRPLQIFQTTLEELSMKLGILPEEVGKDLDFWWIFISSHETTNIPMHTPQGPPHCSIRHSSLTLRAGRRTDPAWKLEWGVWA